MYNDLKKFMLASGVSGDESGISAVLAEAIAPYVDKVYNDPMGSLIAFKKGSAPNAKKLMFAAHMDEIGFMVNYIDDQGFVRVGKMGGINYYSAAFTKVIFNNGTVGALVPDAKVAPKDYRPDAFYVDIGAKNKKEAEHYVHIGDCCRVAPSLEKLCGSRVCGRPIDDRIGCYMLYETAKAMKDCKNDTYFVFTVQEEVGVRGSKTSAFGIMPDYGIAVDIGGCGDTIGANPMPISLGKGAAIKLKDGMVICHSKMVNLMKKTAQDRKIPYQLEILESGGTDTCMLQQAGAGCIAGAISMPTRFGHSTVEIIDMKDAQSGIDIMTGICETVLD